MGFWEDFVVYKSMNKFWRLARLSASEGCGPLEGGVCFLLNNKGFEEGLQGLFYQGLRGWYVDFGGVFEELDEGAGLSSFTQLDSKSYTKPDQP